MPANGNAPAFDAWLDDFFAAYYGAGPVNATFIGVHDYDAALPDFSENGVAGTLAEMKALLKRSESLPAEPLAIAQNLDKTLADGLPAHPALGARAGPLPAWQPGALHERGHLCRHLAVPDRFRAGWRARPDAIARMAGIPQLAGTGAPERAQAPRRPGSRRRSTSAWAPGSSSPRGSICSAASTASPIPHSGTWRGRPRPPSRRIAATWARCSPVEATAMRAVRMPSR